METLNCSLGNIRLDHCGHLGHMASENPERKGEG